MQSMTMIHTMLTRMQRSTDATEAMERMVEWEVKETLDWMLRTFSCLSKTLPVGQQTIGGCLLSSWPRKTEAPDKKGRMAAAEVMAQRVLPPNRY